MSHGFTGFLDYCEWMCICGKPDDAHNWQSQTAAQQAARSQLDQTQYDADSEDDSDTTSSDFNTFNALFPGNVGGSTTDAGAVNIDDIATGDAWYQNPGATDVPKCNGTCEIGTDCPDQDCSCKVTGERLELSLGYVEYFASCTARLLKRDEQVPCPCNITYVSHSCCEAEVGLVWESSDMKLGELVKQDLR